MLIARRPIWLARPWGRTMLASSTGGMAVGEHACVEAPQLRLFHAIRQLVEANAGRSGGAPALSRPAAAATGCLRGATEP